MRKKPCKPRALESECVATMLFRVLPFLSLKVFTQAKLDLMLIFQLFLTTSLYGSLTVVCHAIL